MANTQDDIEDVLLEFVRRCRDEHIAPYPVGLRIAHEYTGLSMYRVRAAFDELLDDGRLTKMPAYPDLGVVLPPDDP
jgi:hypothetical protein